MPLISDLCIVAYNEITRIPAGAYDIEIIEDVATSNLLGNPYLNRSEFRFALQFLIFRHSCRALALADRQGRYFINGRFQKDSAGTYNVFGATFVYTVGSRGEYAKESLRSGGPISSDLIVLVQ